MQEPAPEKALLQGMRVAFTGRLASMTRAEAADLVRAHGGRFTATLNRFTSLLVVGQDGWPFEKDGRLSGKLRKARSLQRKGVGITVLTEEELFARLGLDSRAEGVSRRYSTVQLARLLKIPGDRIRRWAAAGVIRPVETTQGISYFDYGQVVSARTMSRLVEAGVKPERLRRSIEQMQRWMGSIEQPLLQLAILEQGGKLLVRLDDGLADTSGQRQFDFDNLSEPPEVSLRQPPATSQKLFEQGCENEDCGRFDEAVEAYRQALLLGGPNPTICFNLANALNAMGQKEQAVERYYQAVELNRTDVDAWNNLGVVLSDLGRTREAIAAMEQALAIDRDYADAHYNLADLLDESAEEIEATAHWRAYAAKDPCGAWATHARERLNAGGGALIRPGV
jgi:tetratricopeptide (TPR) repeat protein